MSPLAKEVIEKLSNEEDKQVLAEVLDFYDYLKQKKQKELQKKWASIEEDEPTEEECKVILEYKSSKDGTVSLDSLVEELGLNDK